MTQPTENVRSERTETDCAKPIQQPAVQSSARAALPVDRNMLSAELIGKVSAICRGYSMPEDANDAMCKICNALIDYEHGRATSLDAEDGPFSSTFAIYAGESRDKAEEIAKAKERWEISNTSELLQSVRYLLGHLIDATTGSQREHIYSAAASINAASMTARNGIEWGRD